MQKFNQVTGGNCRLSIFRESSQGVIDHTKPGHVINFMSESFAAPPNKQASSVINGKRGAGKPFAGVPNYSGGVSMAPYAPIMGEMLRALCGAPTTSTCPSIALAQKDVVDMNGGYVGIPVAGHEFVQDSAISITGTAHYNGTYRLEYGTTSNILCIKHKYIAEALPDTAKAHRGNGAWLQGQVKDNGNGTITLPVQGAGVSMNVGETVTVTGTKSYDGTYTLQAGTSKSALVITAVYDNSIVDVDNPDPNALDGTAYAMPTFFSHIFALPKKQPTVTFEKFLDYDANASSQPYRTYLSNKINGLSFDFGGDSELTIKVDVSVGSEEGTATSMHPLPPVELPAVPFYNKETAVWVGEDRVGDVQNGNINLTYGIEGASAVGDMGKRTRMPEGDPVSTCTLTVFLEEDFYQSLSDNSSTMRFRLSMSGANGEEFWVEFPESELGTGGAQISGKAGLTQEVTVTGFTDQSPTVNIFTLKNRVASYA